MFKKLTSAALIKIKSNRNVIFYIYYISKQKLFFDDIINSKTNITFLNGDTTKGKIRKF